MMKLSPLSRGLAVFALLQLFFVSSIFAQGSENSGLTIRVTVGGTPTDFVEGECGFGPAPFGGLPTGDLCAQPQWAQDNVGMDSLACDSIPVGSLTGKVGLVRRGACAAPNAANGNFIAKAFNAQRAGAVVVFIANNSANAAQTDCTIQPISGVNDAVVVPVFFLSRQMANFIDDAIDSGQEVEVCLLYPNVKLESAFFPVQNAQTPVFQIAPDTLGFSVNLTNIRGVDITNVTVTASVQTAAGAELFTSTLDIPVLTSDVTDSLFVVPGLFAPELPIGDYAIVYTVDSDPIGTVDLPATDRAIFKVTENLFAKDDGAFSSGFRPGTLPEAGWGVATLYTFYDEGTLDNYVVRTVELANAVNAGETPINELKADLYLFRVIDEVAEDWNLFEETDFLTPSFEFVGTGTYEAPADAASFQIEQAEMYDLATSNLGVPLIKDSYYVLAAFYPDSSATAFHAFDTDVVVPGPEGISTLTYSTQWFLGGFEGNPAAVLRMYVDLLVTTDEKPLPDSYMNVFPNPVKDVVNLGMAFDKATDVTITIADLSGRTVKIEDRFGLTNETVSYQLPQLASGTYLARIATKEGTLTKKFIVQK